MESGTKNLASTAESDTKRKVRALPAGLTHGFRALRIRNFRLFWTAQVISLSGTWMQTTAQAWLVLQLTNSPLAMGVVTTLQFLPITLLALYGGVLADRLPKRRTLIITQSAALIQASLFGLLVITGAIQLWHIYILAMIQGLINAIDNPVRQAFVVELVGREEVVNAVALNSMSFNGARIIGPALAGAVIGWIGIAPTLFLNAVSYIPVVVALLLMHETELFALPPATHGPIIKSLIEGLTYSWRTPSVLRILIVVAAIGTFGFNFSIVLPLIADFVLHTNEQAFGLLFSFFGFGSLVAALSTAYVRQVTIRRLLVGSAAFSLVFGVVALTPVYVISAALLVALGFFGIIFATTSNTLLQLTVPDELRGRVMSLYVLLFAGSTPIGGFLTGALSSSLGVPAALLICAIFCMVGVICALVYQRTASKPQSKQAVAQPTVE
jgi:MFS family permease